MLSVKELNDLFPADSTRNISTTSDRCIDFITHRKEYLNEQSAYVVFKKQNINFNSHAFLSDRDLHIKEPLLVYRDLKEVSRKIALHLNKKRLSECDFYGITGTNGKSTTIKIVSDLINAIDSNKKCASLGTLGFNYKEEIHETFNTTPFPLDLHYLIRKAHTLGARTLATEVSSHALSENRIEGLEFKQIAFTNLSHDHLDFHKTMKAYFNEKLKLINYCKAPPIINFDCPYIKEIANQVDKVFTYSCLDKNVDLFAEINEYNENGIRGQFLYQNKKYLFELNLFGDYNVSNCLCAISVLLNEGYSLQDICEKLPNLKAPVGRMERVLSKSGSMFIDYAHTPDALERTLQTLKKHFPNKDIITVFGCGGDRDINKRPLMAKVSERYSSETIITNDNSRSEDPFQILNQIKSGFTQLSNFEVIQDRESAIQTAIDKLSDNKLCLIAGKGHENWQEINSKKIPFSDHHICQQKYSKI
jgi:UDP-N-acetylmuramoyl-L-alanyl-D-glutamate--2,6-diaminopimelate ligase